jgi:ribosomal protein S18 acetylase RimI-like enzyme
MIRPAQTDDIPEVRAMLREYVAWIGLDLAFQEIEEEIADLPGDYDEPTGALLVAEENHHLVGMIALRPLSGSICEMKRLWVRPEGRGRGVAKELVAQILEQARHLNYDEIRLDTLPMMTNAQSLYESLGFVDIAPYYKTPIKGTRFMAKRL